jgi:hypothetical protein
VISVKSSVERVLYGLFARILDISSVKGRVERGPTMARVAGADIPNDKRVEVALTYI